MVETLIRFLIFIKAPRKKKEANPTFFYSMKPSVYSTGNGDIITAINM